MVNKEAATRLVESKPEPKSQTNFANHFQKMIQQQREKLASSRSKERPLPSAAPKVPSKIPTYGNR